jgi:ubiquinone/menaquinone biosynthesis C-methylase UbiE
MNYNIGAGSFRHPDWTNVDHDSDWYREIQGDSVAIDWDLLSLTQLPVGTNTTDLIYSSHVIEHVTDEAVLNMCKEACRILKPGGIFRVQAPNIDIFYDKFKKGNRIHWLDIKYPINSRVPLKKASLPQTFLWVFAANATRIHTDGAAIRLSDKEIINSFDSMSYEEALNYCASFVSIDKQKKYPGNHMNWWNPDKLTPMLKRAGFSSGYESSFGESQAEELRDTNFFDFKHKEISFYMEARK